MDKESGLRMDYEKIKLPEESTITFNTPSGWVLKIMADGSFKFNHETKMNADEFAKEFIKILEDNVVNRGNN